jgi:3-hydroxyacyl-[acyl-carrier-protein] dehydratase
LPKALAKIHETDFAVSRFVCAPIVSQPEMAMRFLMLDRITKWEPGRRGEAIKNITLSEDFFADHFPLRPIMPGVLIIEGMAQLGGLVLEEGVRLQHGREVKVLMSIIEKAKFRQLVSPGDTLVYSAEVTAINDLGGKVATQATRDGSVIAECDLLFSFHQIDNPHLEKARRDMLDFWLRDLKA